MQRSSKIDHLSVIARQCLAVTRLERFCRHYGISHPALSAFIDHIWMVTQVDSSVFQSWAHRFSSLAVDGFGDEWPAEMRAAMPANMLGTLVNWSNE